MRMLLALLMIASQTLAADELAATSVAVDAIFAGAERLEKRVVDWRRDIHQHPELGFQEHRTAALVARHLESLGMEVTTGVGRTGVVGILRGGKPGPVVALRADMDALPVKEDTGLPFASTATAILEGRTVPVMHACGHDTHVAMLMGAAEILAGLRETLPGTVIFLFQPAEEKPAGTRGGAIEMLQDGVFEEHRPDAVFGLHISPGPLGALMVRPGMTMAGADAFTSTINGRQTHGSTPWRGVDPITVAAQVILGWQAIPSRQIDITQTPAPVVSVGTIHAGNVDNIIPAKVELTGTVRTFSDAQREEVLNRMKHTAQHIATSSGAQAELSVHPGYPPLVNDTALLEQMRPVLAKAARNGQVFPLPLATGAEDFAFFARETAGLYVILGATPEGENPMEAASNHSPRFTIDEAALPIGVRTLALLAVDYLTREAAADVRSK